MAWMKRTVPNAEKTYVDPSALRSIYVHDDRSMRFCKWRQKVGGSLPVTRFGRVEIVNSVKLAAHRELISSAQAEQAIADFEEDFRSGALFVVDALWRRTLDLATTLSDRHTAKTGTRTLDVLHVASAITLGATHFVTYDERQRSLAKIVGLRLLRP
jgi:predicted nucleic acid-binding protein